MMDNDLLTINDIKEMVAVQMTEEVFLEVLGLDIYDLVDLLEDQIIENREDILAELYE